VPIREAYEEGGYEVVIAQRPRLLPIGLGAGEATVETALAVAVSMMSDAPPQTDET